MDLGAALASQHGDRNDEVTAEETAAGDVSGQDKPHATVNGNEADTATAAESEVRATATVDTPGTAEEGVEQAAATTENETGTADTTDKSSAAEEDGKLDADTTGNATGTPETADTASATDKANDPDVSATATVDMPGAAEEGGKQAAATTENATDTAETTDTAITTDKANDPDATGADAGHPNLFRFPENRSSPATNLASADKDSGNPSSGSDGNSEDEQARQNPFSERGEGTEEEEKESKDASAEAAGSSDSAESSDKEQPSEWVVPADPLRHYGRKDIVLMALRGAPGNRRCADCRQSDPDWADLNYGVLLCIQCCGAHRALSRQVPLIKSLSIDSQWTNEQYKLLLRGNDSANAHLEKQRPTVYPIPQPSDSTVLRLQYILAKYDNQEFTEQPVKEPSYRQSEMSARFLKRHRYRADWAPRDFFLSVPEAKIIYGVPANDYGSPCRPTTKQTKGTIPLLKTRAELVNSEALELETNESVLMLIFADEDEKAIASPKTPPSKTLPSTSKTLPSKKTMAVGAKARKLRTVFLKRSGGVVQDLVEWLVAIRRIQLLSAQAAAPPPVIRMGWMMKKGEDPSSNYKKRWFVLDRTELRYYLASMESTSQGSIPLGPSRDGYKVWSSVADSADSNEFTIRTACSRDFWLSAYTSTDFLIWVKYIKEIVDGTPASPTLPKSTPGVARK